MHGWLSLRLCTEAQPHKVNNAGCVETLRNHNALYPETKSKKAQGPHDYCNAGDRRQRTSWAVTRSRLTDGPQVHAAAQTSSSKAKIGIMGQRRCRGIFSTAGWVWLWREHLRKKCLARIEPTRSATLEMDGLASVRIFWGKWGKQLTTSGLSPGYRFYSRR